VRTVTWYPREYSIRFSFALTNLFSSRPYWSANPKAQKQTRMTRLDYSTVTDNSEQSPQCELKRLQTTRWIRFASLRFASHHIQSHFVLSRHDTARCHKRSVQCRPTQQAISLSTKTQNETA
jgi:hypothetical protein